MARQCIGLVLCYLLLFAIGFERRADAQAIASDSSAVSGDEITVGLTIPRLGTFTIPAVLVGDDVYLPVTDLFTTVRIKADNSSDFRRVSGFFIDEGKQYEVDIDKRVIKLGNSSHTIKRNDYVLSENNLYLRRQLFGDIFGLKCSFDFRALEVTIKTELELPAVRDMLREEARKNIGPESADFVADTTFPSQHLFFDGGVLDWSINSNVLPAANVQLYSFNFGGQLLFGETNALITGGYNNRPILDAIPARWRYVTPTNPFVQQIILGNNYAFPSPISLPSTRGVFITNTPVTNRRAFGKYLIADRAQPDWVVELYLNSRLIDFTRTDASGFYQFSVPIVYGTTTITLKFYGPYGEERTEEKQIQIPYTFLPPGELEYNVLAGKLLEPYDRFVSGGGLSFGVSNGISVSGGLYYLPDSLNRAFSPYASASIKLTDGLLFRALYAKDFQYGGVLTLSAGALSIEGAYTRYSALQRFVQTDILEDRKFTLSLPFKSIVSGVLRLSGLESISATSDNITVESGLSTSLWSVPVSYSLSGNFLGPVERIKYGALTSELNLLIRGACEMLIRPTIDFDHTMRRFTMASIAIDRTFGPLYLSANYQRGLQDKTNTFRFDARWDLNFAQLGSTYNQNESGRTVSTNARGTMAFDSKSGVLIADNRTLIGRGGLTVRPFLDRNDNGVRDSGEQFLTKLDVHIANGRILQSEEDPIVRVVDLEPYKPFLLKTSGLAFENLAWRPSFETAKITMEANRFKTIDLPVFIAGEASGRVDRVGNDGKHVGMENVTVIFIRDDGARSDSVQSVTGGEFDFFGLRPGKYHAKVDPWALRRASLVSEPESLPLEIRPIEAGDIVEKLNFSLRPKGEK